MCKDDGFRPVNDFLFGIVSVAVRKLENLSTKKQTTRGARVLTECTANALRRKNERKRRQVDVSHGLLQTASRSGYKTAVEEFSYTMLEGWRPSFVKSPKSKNSSVELLTVSDEEVVPG